MKQDEDDDDGRWASESWSHKNRDRITTLIPSVYVTWRRHALNHKSIWGVKKKPRGPSLSLSRMLNELLILFMHSFCALFVCECQVKVKAWEIDDDCHLMSQWVHYGAILSKTHHQSPLQIKPHCFGVSSISPHNNNNMPQTINWWWWPFDLPWIHIWFAQREAMIGGEGRPSLSLSLSMWLELENRERETQLERRKWERTHTGMRKAANEQNAAPPINGQKGLRVLALQGKEGEQGANWPIICQE